MPSMLRGFALTLSTARPIHGLEGFVPAQSGEMESGFECYHDDDSELLVAYASVDFGHPWRFALSFRWGGNLAACLAAYQAGAAYAKATGGVLFDPEQGEILAPQKAVEAARQLEKDLREAEL